MRSNVYADMGARTNGHIYVGVVGPVRSGKSTFIKRFMETVVLPHIHDEEMRRRTVDELPQSSGGRTIMTTEPKFIPEEAVTVDLDGGHKASVRLIDSVGYILPGAIGYIEKDAPRMVATPWFDREIPFNMAAEIGTQKVMNDHSTVGIVITSDGSVTGIDWKEYRECEERIISELMEIGKPFAVVINSTDPGSNEVMEHKRKLEEKYGVPVLSVDCLHMNADIMTEILSALLGEFPVTSVRIDMPGWILQLEKEHWLKNSVFGTVKECTETVSKMKDASRIAEALSENEYISEVIGKDFNMGTGEIRLELKPQEQLFYKILGDATGLEITDDTDLIMQVKRLADAKERFDKISGALEEVSATGYGIVMPTIEELTLEEPQIVKQGGKYGVKLKASAPSLHILRADITTEVSPIVGRAAHISVTTICIIDFCIPDDVK